MEEPLRQQRTVRLLYCQLDLPMDLVDFYQTGEVLFFMVKDFQLGAGLVWIGPL